MKAELYLKVNESYKRLEMLEKLKKIAKNREVVFLCVGNPKIWFDSFGPLMGSLLKFLDVEKFIYGNIKAPILSFNIEEYISMIYRFHVKPYIVVIDNAISNVSKSCIKIKEGSTKCASLSNPVSVGDMSILCCLNKNEIKDSLNYKNILFQIKDVGRMIKFVFENNNS